MKFNVLIIEDNKYMQDFFAGMLASDDRFGEVNSLRDAAQGLYFCTANHADLSRFRHTGANCGAYRRLCGICGQLQCVEFG